MAVVEIVGEYGAGERIEKGEESGAEQGVENDAEQENKSLDIINVFKQ